MVPDRIKLQLNWLNLRVRLRIEAKRKSTNMAYTAIAKSAITLSLLLGLMACQPTTEPSPPAPPINEMKIAHLSEGDESNFEAIRSTFADRNPGYDMAYHTNQKALPQAEAPWVVFIQEGGGTATINGENSSKFSVGDILMLQKGDRVETDSLFSALVFTVPEIAPDNIPAFVRPDWDMNITDTPGGCATETNAYRRILLTWLDKVGPYSFHAINAHRVRIMDSFSHYHPVEGGFDEFYLVQMVLPGAKILTSSHVKMIEKPERIAEEQAAGLIQSTPLQVGDLVYLPRGIVHRGVGGVLAQVITVPGFVPGSEIGVDHHLKKINDILSLKGKQALPFNQSASTKAVIK